MPASKFFGDRRRLSLVLQYALLLVLFTRVIWGIWDVRDLTFGDTSSYYKLAVAFADHFGCHFIWSPLYTSFFGVFHWINADPYFAVIAHRVVILLALVVLIFEVSRRLLAPIFAWFVTAWWIVLPINHGALYEVHLFALIPILIFWLLLAWGRSVWIRGSCVGLLVLATALMRNELLLAVGMFAAASVAFDFWRIWKRGARFDPLRHLAAYGLPVAVALALTALAYARSDVKYPELGPMAKIKHTLNVSQIYCFGYGQRHPEYKDDPWTRYQALMIRDFGNELPTMREAIAANPKAMLEHFWWNVTLIPSGLQLALFDCRGGPFNPDYPPTPVNVGRAWLLTAVYLLVVIVGAGLFAANGRYWWRAWIEPRAWMLVGILCIGATVGVVMIMQRPRPSYMFGFSLPLMLLFGFALQVIGHRCRAEGWVPRLGWVAAVLVTFLFPPYYAPAATKSGKSGKAGVTQNIPERPLLAMLRLLQARGADIAAVPKARVATPGMVAPLQNYLGYHANAEGKSRFMDSDALLRRLPPAANLANFFQLRDVRFVIVAPWQKSDVRMKTFLAEAGARGWIVDSGAPGLGRQYELYYLPSPSPGR